VLLLDLEEGILLRVGGHHLSDGLVEMLRYDTQALGAEGNEPDLGIAAWRSRTASRAAMRCDAMRWLWVLRWVDDVGSQRGSLHLRLFCPLRRRGGSARPRVWLHSHIRIGRDFGLRSV